MGKPYHSYTYKDPFWFKRWLHQRRFTDALKLLDLKEVDKLLDYGCGDGYFLKVCADQTNNRNLYGYEPAEVMIDHARKILNNRPAEVYQSIADLPEKKFSKIACLETGEHLTDEDLGRLFQTTRALLADNGRMVISVPVETGLPALVKNGYRLLTRKKYDNLNFKNYLRSILGLAIFRPVSQIDDGVDYYFSHVGFDHRKFEKQLKQHFSVEKKQPTPVFWLRDGLNNTIYYIVKPL
ncbi:MAG: class I SAM-dependent methyltransferase [Patescibacteria group bacterium]